MATVDQHMAHAGGDSRSGPAAGRHGRDTLTEVTSIQKEPERPRAPGILGSLVTMARGFTSSRRPGDVGAIHPPSAAVACPSCPAHPIRPAPHDAA